MLAKINVTCNGADCRAELTGTLIPWVEVPVHIDLQGWDDLTKRTLYVGIRMSDEKTEILKRIDISEVLDTAIPGNCLVGGYFLKIGLEGESSDGRRRIPTTWSLAGYVLQAK